MSMALLRSPASAAPPASRKSNSFRVVSSVADASPLLFNLLRFTLAMIGGGWVLFTFYDVPQALEVLTSDFRGEPASRLPALVRGIWLVVSYSLAIASIVVAKGREPKGRSEEVTSAMTSSVIRTTLFVVAMELASVVLLYAITGGSR